MEKIDNLVDWKNPPKVQDLRTDLDRSLNAYYEQKSTIEKYHRAINGELKFTPRKNRSKVQPKVIKKTIEWTAASLSEPFLSNDKLISIEPRTHEDVPRAEQNMLVLNYQFNNEIDKVQFIDDYVRTATSEGTVIVQTGWENIKGEKEVEVQKELLGEELIEYLKPMVQSKQIPQEQANEIVRSGQPYPITTIERQTTNVVNRPTVEVVDYDKVIIDPLCRGNMDKCQFVIVPFETSMSELKSNENYSNLDEALTPDDDNVSMTESTTDSAFSDAFIEDSGFSFSDKARKKIIAYEYYGYWDIDDTGITKPIKATWVGETMIQLIELPYPDRKLPFVVVPFIPVKNSVFGEPHGALIEDNQDIIGAVTRGMIDVMGRSANGQIGVSKDLLDSVNRKKFEDGENFMFNPTTSPQHGIQMQQFPEIPRSAMEMLQVQNNEAESMTGVKAFSQGISSGSLGSVATGIRGALDSASKRELSVLRRLASGIEQIARKIVAMNSEFLDEEKIVRLSNDEFVSVRRDDLDGAYDLKVKVSTAEYNNMLIEKLTMMMQTGQQSMHPDEAKITRAKIYDLQNLPDLAQMVREYQPQPDPLAERMKELEVELMEAKVANERAKAGENEVDIQLKAAKARDLESKADMTDLDFVEREQGLDHNREMEKLEASKKNKV
jgi:hypothetical protein